jgi:hypothetical protein
MSYLHASGRCSRKCGLEGSALFTLSGRRAFFSAAVVLPLQPDEMIREALDSLTGLGGELVCCGIINRSCCSHDLVSAAQEGTSLAEERLCLLGCLRRRGGRAQVGGRAVCHGDSFPLSRRRDLCSGATAALVGPTRPGIPRCSDDAESLRQSASSGEGQEQLGRMRQLLRGGWLARTWADRRPQYHGSLTAESAGKVEGGGRSARRFRLGGSRYG